MRRSVLITLAACGLILAFGAAAVAADLELDLGLGARAMGMAGAYVAVADDGTAPYWNPAGITQIDVVEFTPSLSIKGDFDIPSTSIGVDEFPPDFGNLDLQLNGMAGVIFRGFAVSALLEARAETTQTETESIGNVGVFGTGMLTLAHEFGGLIAVGANLKYIQGEGLVFIAQESPSSGSYRESTARGYALDLGALFKAGELFRLGAVYENAYAAVDADWTSYTYDPVEEVWEVDETGTEDASPDAVFHLGAAFKTPGLGTLISVQIDNADALVYRVGFEQSLLVLKLRGGVIMDDGFDPQWITAGVGFKLGPVVLDAAAVTDTDLAPEAYALTAGFAF